MKNLKNLTVKAAASQNGTQTSQTETAQKEALQVPTIETEILEANKDFIASHFSDASYRSGSLAAMVLRLLDTKTEQAAQHLEIINGLLTSYKKDTVSIEKLNELLEVFEKEDAREAQIKDAIKTHLLGVKPNKSAFCKAYFGINSTTSENFAAHKKDIQAIFEANNLATDTYNFIGNYYKEFIGQPYDKGTSNSQTVKAKTSEPQQTTEQQNTLSTLATMFGVDSELYKQAEAQILADVEKRKKEWAKEQIENDRKNKSVFVKNFIRQNNNIEFLNSLFELCKAEEAKQAAENTHTEDDNKPF